MIDAMTDLSWQLSIWEILVCLKLFQTNKHINIVLFICLCLQVKRKRKERRKLSKDKAKLLTWAVPFSWENIIFCPFFFFFLLQKIILIIINLKGTLLCVLLAPYFPQLWGQRGKQLWQMNPSKQPGTSSWGRNRLWQGICKISLRPSWYSSLKMTYSFAASKWSFRLG